MFRNHHIGTHLGRTPHGRIKIVNLKPEQHPVPVRFVITVADGTVMMLYLEAVQLKNEFAIEHQLFIRAAPMITPAAEQSLVPLAASFHIGDSDQRLRPHSASVSILSVTCRAYQMPSPLHAEPITCLETHILGEVYKESGMSSFSGAFDIAVLFRFFARRPGRFQLGDDG